MPRPDPLIRLVLADACHRIYAMTDGAPLTFEGFARQLRATGPLAADLLDDPALDRADTDRPDEWKLVVARIRRTSRHDLRTVSKNESVCTCRRRPTPSVLGQGVFGG